MKASSQFRSALTLSRYSLLSMLRSPTSLVFSLLFPIIFIVVFGSMVGEQMPVIKLGVAQTCDTTNLIFGAIAKIPSIKLMRNLSPEEQSDALKKGTLTAVLNISPKKGGSTGSSYHINLLSAGATPATLSLLKTTIQVAIRQANEHLFPNNSSIASLDMTQAPGRVYRQIDFILPGQLGFSLLMAGVFGSSFLLFHLRQSLVLKRLRVTSIRKVSIIGGEMLSRLFFHVIAFIIMVWQMQRELAGLLIWTVVIGVWSVRSFKWE